VNTLDQMSRDPDELRARRREALARQRRRRLLGGLLAVALVVVAAAIVLVVVGGDDDETPVPEPEASLPRLSPSRMAGQRLIAGFDGPNVPKGLERLIASGRLAGVILFADNIESPAKTARTIASLQAIERPAGLEQPLAVMVDQEGGAVRRIPGPPTSSGADIGRRGARFAAAQGRATAEALLTYGFNIDLAPVLDLARPGSAIAAEGRSFGSDPNRVADVGVDGFAAGLRAGGVAATAKHFPGLGAATVNTDLEAQSIDVPLRRLRALDEAPFSAFADSGGELIMLGLASYSALGDRPAALDPAVATGELRDHLGFDGVSITDSLDAAAARAFGDRDRVALAAAGAGTDLLLYGDWRTARAVGRTLAVRLRSGALDRGPFAASFGRVLAMREALTRP
jgi:beta-N-acetylhexosaminidase